KKNEIFCNLKFSSAPFERKINEGAIFEIVNSTPILKRQMTNSDIIKELQKYQATYVPDEFLDGLNQKQVIEKLKEYNVLIKNGDLSIYETTLTLKSQTTGASYKLVCTEQNNFDEEALLQGLFNFGLLKPVADF
ncbi:MAG: hypothetical protein KDD33_11845, partial [Bdellovibrionales bacterium]|nr:hypothetical protein [Bdellovibrionales bacterium]